MRRLQRIGSGARAGAVWGILLGVCVAGPVRALTDANGQTPRAAETRDTSTPNPNDRITLDERVFSPDAATFGGLGRSMTVASAFSSSA